MPDVPKVRQDEVFRGKLNPGKFEPHVLRGAIRKNGDNIFAFAKRMEKCGQSLKVLFPIVRARL